MPPVGCLGGPAGLEVRRAAQHAARPRPRRRPPLHAHRRRCSRGEGPRPAGGHRPCWHGRLWEDAGAEAGQAEGGAAAQGRPAGHGLPAGEEAHGGGRRQDSCFVKETCREEGRRGGRAEGEAVRGAEEGGEAAAGDPALRQGEARVRGRDGREDRREAPARREGARRRPHEGRPPGQAGSLRPEAPRGVPEGPAAGGEPPGADLRQAGTARGPAGGQAHASRRRAPDARRGFADQIPRQAAQNLRSRGGDCGGEAGQAPEVPGEPQEVPG
mmetsp:Transcript_23769/g.64713  ORF Transcript_23769/g.64713 Transcript_23769/m.64713 type:complete len:271 (-) Transcript_23769:678-1490(-)